MVDWNTVTESMVIGTKSLFPACKRIPKSLSITLFLLLAIGKKRNIFDFSFNYSTLIRKSAKIYFFLQFIINTRY